MDISLDRIALVTTVCNQLLYKKTVNTFPKNIDLIAIDGSKGLFGIDSIKFMFDKLSSDTYDWIIMADEDVLFIAPNEVFSIIEKMNNENIVVCGVRDGGVLSWRDKNPFLVNPFFCILNFKTIKSIYNRDEIDKNQYILENEFADDLSKLPFKYDEKSIFEEYYCFFLWLRRKEMKFEFLDAVSNTFENDLETTTVFDLNGNAFLYHTWYARTYGVNEYHTERINKIINLCNLENDNRKIVWLKDSFFNVKKDFNKIKNKLINRINLLFK
jgi:hypothetical protein